MSNLHGFLDWLLFSLTLTIILYAAIILLNMLVLLFRGVGFTNGALFSRIVLFVIAGVGGYIMLVRVLGVLG